MHRLQKFHKSWQGVGVCFHDCDSFIRSYKITEFSKRSNMKKKISLITTAPVGIQHDLMCHNSMNRFMIINKTFSKHDFVQGLSINSLKKQRHTTCVCVSIYTLWVDVCCGLITSQSRTHLGLGKSADKLLELSWMPLPGLLVITQ